MTTIDWDTRRKHITEVSNKLSPIPKELKWFSKFNILKMAVLEKIETATVTNQISTDDLENLELKKTKTVGEDPYIFTERLVNLMMHYAYEQGKLDVAEKHAHDTKIMRDTLDKIKDALDDADWIEYPSSEEW